MQHRLRLRPRATIVSSTLVAAGAIGLAALTASPAQAAPTATTATIDAPATATVGTAFDVDLTIPATTDVYAYEITLDADADSVSYVEDSVTGPDGGFDSVEQDGDALTIVHTRLGTSPALDGDLAASIGLTPTAPGSVDLAVTSITLVGSDGTSTTLTDPASTSISIAAAATATPTPTPTATPTPGATATADPGAGAGDPDPTTTVGPTDPTDPSDPTSGATAVAAGGGDRPTGGELAWTGADVAPWIAASLALLAAGGILITLRARRARRERTGAAE
ncbi:MULTISPECIES: hypothetical protein [unclassified Curtobacterium]|uniref:hypothetical protein n=1 Tax=unclassified Curtobacterium TaxID=257496 RepID=UPI0010492D0B|nr:MULTISPECIES: hypothetical protein [unclassified Curtobacterium]TCL77980.1 hypothetical protein EDF23_10528 [Curtobacterium sp. PhB128]TCL94705.1 hypothetical protein EDF29_10528 [Curtobacterium sp. PhB138]